LGKKKVNGETKRIVADKVEISNLFKKNHEEFFQRKEIHKLKRMEEIKKEFIGKKGSGMEF
jgi:hypothetical protein